MDDRELSARLQKLEEQTALIIDMLDTMDTKGTLKKDKEPEDKVHIKTKLPQ